MKEFDSIRIVDKGGDSISFEMTGNVAGSPYDTIVFFASGNFRPDCCLGQGRR